jgi:hypothetical protein
MQKYIKKMAKLKQAKLWETLKPGLAFGAVAAGAPLLVEGIRKAYHAIAKNSRFENMMKITPSLKDEDPNKVRMAFNSLHNLNPGFAKDPLVAGTFVKKTLDTDIGGGMAVDPQTAASLTGASPAAPMSEVGSKIMMGVARGAGQVARDITAPEPEPETPSKKIHEHYYMPKGQTPPT